MDDTTFTDRPSTLADVLSYLKTAEGLTERQRRDQRSAVSCFCRITGRDASEVIVDIPALRKELNKLHHVQVGIAKPTLANIKTNLRLALQTFGALPARDRQRQISDRWQSFLAALTKPYQTSFLTRLAGFCTAIGVEPEDVSDAIMAAFHAHLETRLLCGDPENICREAKNKFNAIVLEKHLPVPRLTTRKTSRRNLPLSAYPMSIQEDLEALLAKRRKPDLFDEKAVSRAHSTVTLRNVKAHVRQALGAAISAGLTPGDFTSLAALVGKDGVVATFTELRRRNGGEFLKAHYEIAYTLLGIARHHVDAPQADIDRIANVKRRIAQELDLRGGTMGDRPKRQLEQFIYEPENVHRLLLLPEKVLAGLQNASPTRNNAIEAMRAAAIAILLSCPIRIKNLSALELGTHIQPVQLNGKKRFRLQLKSSEVKNHVNIEAVLAAYVSRLLDIYLSRYRKLITSQPTTVLFPTRDGGLRNPGDFGASLTKCVHDATGIHLTPHTFRHFAAYLHLRERPGEYLKVQKALGHKKLDTTIKFYAPLTSASALEEYGNLLDAIWETGKKR